MAGREGGVSAAEHFFAEVSAHADAAEAGAEITENWYSIAGKTLLIRFLGSALLPVITSAIAHRKIDPPAHPPDLTLRCWDCATLRQPFPMAPIDKSGFRPRGEVRPLSDA